MESNTNLSRSSKGTKDQILCIRTVTPPQRMLIVGGGESESDLMDALSPQNALIVEGEKNRYDALYDQHMDDPNVDLLQAVVAGDNTTRSFHSLSIRSESGIIEPAALAPIWPNLKVLHTQDVTPITLAEIYQKNGSSNSAPADINWLVINCLPAGEILTGADTIMVEQLDVVIVRVLSTQKHDLDPTLASASDRAVHEFLSHRNFRRTSIIPEQHPNFCTAFYIKDWRAALKQSLEEAFVGFSREREEQTNKIRILDSELSTYRTHIENQQEELISCRGVKEVLQKDLDSKQRLIENLQNSIEERQNELDSSRQLYAETKTERDGLEQTLASIQIRLTETEDNIETIKQTSSDEIAKITAQLESSNNNCTSLQSSLAFAQENSSDLKSTLKELQTKFNQQQDALKAMNDACTVATKERDELARHMHDAQQTATNQANAISRLEATREKLTHELQKSASSYNSAIVTRDTLSGDVEKLEEKLKKNEAERAALNAEMGKFQAINQELKSNQSSLESDIEKLKTDLQKATSEVAALKTEKVKSETELQRLQINLEKLTEAREALAKDIKTHQDLRTELEDNAERAEQARQLARADLDDLRNQHEALQVAFKKQTTLVKQLETGLRKLLEDD